MINRTMSAKEARANFSELLGSVYYTNNPVIVERKGRPFAVVISPEQYEGLIKQQDKAWEVVEQIQARNQDKDSDEVMADLTKAVEEVRKERYAKLQTKTIKSSY